MTVFAAVFHEIQALGVVYRAEKWYNKPNNELTERLCENNCPKN